MQLSIDGFVFAGQLLRLRDGILASLQQLRPASRAMNTAALLLPMCHVLPTTVLSAYCCSAAAASSALASARRRLNTEPRAVWRTPPCGRAAPAVIFPGTLAACLAVRCGCSRLVTAAILAAGAGSRAAAGWLTPPPPLSVDGAAPFTAGGDMLEPPPLAAASCARRCCSCLDSSAHTLMEGMARPVPACGMHLRMCE